MQTNRVLIHLQTQNEPNEKVLEKDLDVPADLKLERLAEYLAHAIRWYDRKFSYSLTVQEPLQVTLTPGQLLAETGLWDGTYLLLSRSAKPEAKASVAQKLDDANKKLPSADQASVWFESETNKYFITSEKRVIGRSTPQTNEADLNVLIDLAQEPNADTVSRNHASLSCQGHIWYLYVASRKVTFRNDQQLQPDESYSLRHGDILKFGQVTLTFKLK